MLKNKLNRLITHDFLDVLRGIAVIMVIAIHAGFIYTNLVEEEYRESNSTSFDIIVFLARFGSAGPMLFFVISGFLMAMLYFNKYESRLFFKRRIFRILPMWILFSVIASLGILNYGNAPDLFTIFGIAALIINIAFLSLFFTKLWDFVPGGWSIQAEMVNYTLFHIMKKSKIIYVLLFQMVISLITLLLEIIQASESILIPIQIINTGAFWFFIGVLFSNYIKNNQKPTMLELSIITASFIITMFTNAPNEISQLQSLVSVIGGILIGACLVKVKYLSGLIVEVGKYSYGIYLIHFIIVKLTIQYLVAYQINIINPIVTWFIIITITTVLSYLIAKPIFNIFEKHFIDKARSLKADRT